MADLLSLGKSWGKPFLDAIGFPYGEPTPTRAPRTKRKAKDDGRGSSKKPRHPPAHYRAASYASAPVATQSGSKGKASARTGSVGRMKLVGRRSSASETIAAEPTTKAQLAAKKPSSSTSVKPTTPKKAEQPWKAGISTAEKWSTRPNKLARELAAHTNEAKRLIQASIQEPEYALRDIEIRDGLWQMMNLIETFATDVSADQEYPTYSGKIIPGYFANNLQPDTAKIIGCVASGGPGGVQGWSDLFIDEQKRRALICAVVGKILVEQVFGHLFFGGEKEEIKAITELQMKHRNDDGFDRTLYYATAIRGILAGRSQSLTLPTNFSSHVSYITTALLEHLRIFNPSITTSPFIAPLHKIVTHAGLLSLSMRLDAHTVYYFEPVFKEDTFTSKRMECFNFRDMQQRNPRTADSEPALDAGEKQRRAKLSEKEKKRGKFDDPLTQITIMDGVTAYRLGGWETPTSTNTRIEYEKLEYGRQGVRARILTHGWVYCRWGRARRFKDGKADDVKDVHGDAWKAPGFVEFAAVTGVPDWLQMEKKEAEAGRKEWESKNKGKGKGRAASVKGKERAVTPEVVEVRAGRRKSSRGRSKDAGKSRRDSAYQEMEDEDALEAQLSVEMQAMVDAE